jgi:hypothetical protein
LNSELSGAIPKYVPETNIVKILVDEPEENPSDDFLRLGKTISNAITNSDPHFTLGIYGEWGTGKTTLMKQIEQNLCHNENSGNNDEKKIITVWFNAWRYEREEQLATIALLKTIGYTLSEYPKFESVSETIQKGLTIVGKDVLRQIITKLISEKGMNEFETELLSKVKFLSQIERETIYFDGLEAIRNQIKKIRRKDKDYRIVVFIDDLDRCSPQKALEVLESIKVFLDMEGFIYVVGLSHDTIDRLITYAYNKIGIQGKDYIKKIIQIPIKLPNWHKNDIISLLESSLIKKIGRKYSNLLLENSTILTQAVNNNPRQLKRFINNLIIAFSTFSNDKDTKNASLRALFVVQIMKITMPDFLDDFIKDAIVRKHLNDILKHFRNLIFDQKTNTARPFTFIRRSKPPRSIINLYQEIQIDSQSLTANKLPDEKSLTGSPQELKQKKSIHMRTIFREYFDPKRENSRGASQYINIFSKLTSSDWMFLKKFRTEISEDIDWTAYYKATEIVEEIPREQLGI